MTFTERKGVRRRHAAMFATGCVFALVVAGSCGGNQPATVGPSPAPVLTVYDEPCNRVEPVPQYEANAIAVYAEHEFPGIAALELADRVTVVVPSKYTVGEYTMAIRVDRFDESILVRDGAVAVICNIQNEPQVAF